MANKVMTWVLIMVLLLGQSYTYASVPCESKGMATDPRSHDMSGMDHSMLEHEMPPLMQELKQQKVQKDMHANMQHDISQQTVAMDCCDQECSCLNGIYSSITLTHVMTVTALNLASKPSGFYLFSIPDAFLPSLRKPPIIG